MTRFAIGRRDVMKESFTSPDVMNDSFMTFWAAAARPRYLA
ncbi:hypothetical protein [Amycolatopsis pretoriensis]|nr:hypothetical protein [Amycolatopsis pretoriensis]